MTGRGTAQRPNGAAQQKISQFKLVLLGESAVGKSSLVLRFVKGQFHEYQESTIGGKVNTDVSKFTLIVFMLYDNITLVIFFSLHIFKANTYTSIASLST